MIKPEPATPICGPAPSFYTIQTGSFINEARAQKQFDFIFNKADGLELDHLRVEKIGNYYAVRIGRFNDYHEAKKILLPVRDRFTDALIMKVRIRDENVLKIFKDCPYLAEHRSLTKGRPELF